ncbi:MAG: carboxypeptidase regulatory-like domain-containing protein [Gemmatimonadaceae bacterium]|nr:carboxypeptidase regulatory-like domain-containing protein [Gemmatimonadaceae bacterium]
MRRFFRPTLTLAVFSLAAISDRLAAQGATPPVPKRDSVATATITGVVLDSIGKPVPRATVRVAAGSPSTTTDVEGRFRLEGVPAGEARVQVTGDGYAPLGFEFAIAANVTVSLKLTLLPAPPAPLPPVVAATETAVVTPGPPDTIKAPPGRTSISGSVVDSAGKPIFGASVQAISTNISTVTDSGGRFRVQNLVPGLVFVRVRKIGYLSEYFPLQTESGRVATLTVKLRPASNAPSLARVEVRADARRDARMVGFYERMRLGNGIFVEREELLRRNASNVSEVLRGRNGVNIIRDGNNNPVVFGRNLTGAGYCAMGVLVDGVFVNTSGMSMDQLVNTQDVRAIEVYKTGPSVPSEFQRRETDCGAVLIWTR